MLRIHQPYIKSSKYRNRYTFTLASIGVLLLGSLVVVNSFSVDAKVYASGDTRTLSDISTMQEMTQQICSNSEDLETNSLLDSRGGVNNYYIVIKLKDGNCWMQENLRLGGSSAIALTPSDSNVTSNYILPASNDGVWSQSDPAGGRIRVGKTSSNMGGYQSGYGNYYSWNAAVASTGGSGSICPKAWHLPTGGGSGSNGMGEFGTLTNDLNASIITASPYIFLAAGFVSHNGSLVDAGSYGRYWSSTHNGSSSAYFLYFSSSFVNPGTGNSDRYPGYPVRCVAEGGLDKIEKPLFSEEAECNVNVVIPSTLTIDATSGIAENADSSKITEGTATATVSSNTDYTVTLHSSQPALKDPAITTAEISPVSEANPVQPGNNSWGFWSNKTNADGSKIYDTPITTGPQEFYNTTVSSITDKGNTTTHTYYVGISIAPSLPSGTYSTDVTITASVK